MDEKLDWNDKEFIQAQEQMSKMYDKKKITTRSDGFVIYKPEADKELVIVPSRYAKELVIWQHRKMCHANHAKVATALAKTFHWPRVSYGMDYYAVATSEGGYKHILGIIDLATSEIRLFPTKNRTGATTADCLLHGVYLRNGIPGKIHSDHAKEFVGKAVKRISSLLGCRRTTTLAHHPTGNSTIERLWQYVAVVLKQMNDAQYKQWDKYVRLIEHTWNNTVHTLLGVSPFEAAHGLPAKSVTESLAKGTPPTAAEAKRRGRKVKHLLYFKGPATITNVRTPTTYDIEYNGKNYARATAELRPYKGKATSAMLHHPVMETNDTAIKKGEIIAYRDDRTRNKTNISCFEICK